MSIDVEGILADLANRKAKRAFRRIDLNKEMARLNAEDERDDVTAANLKAIYSESGSAPQKEAAPPDAIESSPAPPATAAQKQVSAGAMTVKDMALAALRDAYPQGLTAAQIKGKAFLKFKKHLNPNTLTVSLCRLKPKVYCEGRTWYYDRDGGGARQRFNDIWRIDSEKEKPRANGASNELPGHTP